MAITRTNELATVTKLDAANKTNPTIINLLYHATKENLSNLSTAVSYFGGKLYAQIPHVRAYHPLGHLLLRRNAAEKFTKIAEKKHSNGLLSGVVTYWSSLSFRSFYVTSNEARHAFVRESHVGITDDAAWNFLKTLSGGNNVMTTFPAFRPIDSQAYRMQRTFLMNRFHRGAKQRLEKIAVVTKNFLADFSLKNHSTPQALRDFVTLLVLHTSSHLLGLTQVTLDNFYQEDKEFAKAIDHVARYGVSQRCNSALEATLYRFFLRIFESNFAIIKGETAEINLIRNIFTSLEVEFPATFADFANIPQDLRHTIAMNFISTGIGAMVHSTANSLDWALARLLKEPAKLKEFERLMTQHKDLDLTDAAIFDKGQMALFPICAWVLHNVFLYPTFSHEFFPNLQKSTVTLPDQSKIELPNYSFILVNYRQSNLSNAKMTDAKTFPNELAQNDTVGRFIMDKRVASFGGSLVSKDNPWTRFCPGAKTSLLEQMIMIAAIIRDYSLLLTDAQKTSCDIDPTMHPICARKKTGHIILATKQAVTPKAESEEKSSCMKNINRFFNRIKLIDAQTAKKLFNTGVTMSAAIALHALTS